jgi:hypothetical protein
MGDVFAKTFAFISTADRYIQKKSVQKSFVLIAEGEQLPGSAGALESHGLWQSSFNTAFLHMNTDGAVGLALSQGVFLIGRRCLRRWL